MVYMGFLYYNMQEINNQEDNFDIVPKVQGQRPCNWRREEQTLNLTTHV